MHKLSLADLGYAMYYDPKASGYVVNTADRSSMACAECGFFQNFPWVDADFKPGRQSLPISRSADGVVIINGEVHRFFNKNGFRGITCVKLNKCKRDMYALTVFDGEPIKLSKHVSVTCEMTKRCRTCGRKTPALANTFKTFTKPKHHKFIPIAQYPTTHCSSTPWMYFTAERFGDPLDGPWLFVNDAGRQLLDDSPFTRAIDFTPAYLEGTVLDDIALSSVTEWMYQIDIPVELTRRAESLMRTFAIKRNSPRRRSNK